MKQVNFARVKLVYFTGTGGTKRVADYFEKSLTHLGVEVNKTEIRKGTYYSNDKEDLLILLFAVHAANAPLPVYEWIDAISNVNSIPAVVIAVSGGGEITPNTACRLSSIKRLERKGYKVVYENMLIMPSNWIVPTADGLSIRLLKILPVKIDNMIKDIFSGTINRIKPKFIDRIISRLGELEKIGARSFGRRIKVNSCCTGCGWCERSCPRENIKLLNNIPVFNSDCVICLRCIYGCPHNAIKPGMLKFLYIKDGYNLEAIEERMDGVSLQPVEELAKGYLWKGVREYLNKYDI